MTRPSDTSTDLDEAIRSVLARQADALVTPDLDAHDITTADYVAHDPAERGRRHAYWMGAAAAAVVTVGAVGLMLDRGQDDLGTAPAAPTGNDAPSEDIGDVRPSAQAFVFETAQVSFAAADVVIDVNGRLFRPAAGVTVGGDPGSDSYGTLELSWAEHETEMRLVLYFAADGTDWWVSEIRVYNGAPGRSATWLEPTAVGEWFRSPLGTAYQGDFDLGYLRLDGMTLEPFQPPAICSNPGAAVGLHSPYARFDLLADDIANAGRFNGDLSLYDTATCTALTLDGVLVEMISADPAVLVVRTPPTVDGADITRAHYELAPVGAGETVVQVVARDEGTGEVLAELDIPARVQAG